MTERRNIYKQHTNWSGFPVEKRYLATAVCLSMGPLTGHPVYTKDNFFLSSTAEFKTNSSDNPDSRQITERTEQTFSSLHRRGVFSVFTITIRTRVRIIYSLIRTFLTTGNRN